MVSRKRSRVCVADLKNPEEGSQGSRVSVPLLDPREEKEGEEEEETAAGDNNSQDGRGSK